MQPIATLQKPISLRHLFSASLMGMMMLSSRLATAAGFDKIEDTVININTILVTISIAVVTIAIIGPASR